MLFVDLHKILGEIPAVLVPSFAPVSALEN